MIKFRFANKNDIDIYFKWANDELVRESSYNSEPIDYKSHEIWFKNKLKDSKSFFYLFENDQSEPVGQVRIEQKDNEVVIGISVEKKFRGQSLSCQMLIKATEDYLVRFSNHVIAAYIKKDNLASYKAFLKAGFEEESEVIINKVESYKLTKRSSQF